MWATCDHFSVSPETVSFGAIRELSLPLLGELAALPVVRAIRARPFSALASLLPARCTACRVAFHLLGCARWMLRHRFNALALDTRTRSACLARLLAALSGRGSVRAAVAIASEERACAVEWACREEAPAALAPIVSRARHVIASNLAVDRPNVRRVRAVNIIAFLISFGAWTSAGFPWSASPSRRRGDPVGKSRPQVCEAVLGDRVLGAARGLSGEDRPSMSAYSGAGHMYAGACSAGPRRPAI